MASSPYLETGIKICLLYINHRDKGGVQGHIFVAVLAFLLERVLEKKLKAARIGLSAKAALEALRTVHIFYTNVKHGLGEPRAEA